MKAICCLEDIKALKEEELPAFYIEVIETAFHERYEAEGEDCSIESFQLPIHACICHAKGKVTSEYIADRLLNIEYVEHETLTDGTCYFRIGIMNDLEMIVVYALESIVSEDTREWLLLESLV